MIFINSILKIKKKRKKMAQRTTRASRGEHTAGIIHTNESIQSSIFSAQKNIKVRKWRRVLVKLGQLKIPRWIPDTDTPNEDLQNFSRPNKRALHKKAAKTRGRKKLATKDVRQEVIGEIDDYEN
mmetsp:Transcript_14532/g.15222  ORF Transcript_14532/g.15222 Transcript_14532/m.15222 type:complete len:125 (+) Transcript_14532:1-375(+)